MCIAVSVGATRCEREGATRAVRCEREGAMRAAACALLLLSAALAASAASEKRADMSPVPFVMGSRYGRSSPRLMAPRNDKFFMGSRYGKRSEPARVGAASAGGAGLSAAGAGAGAGAAGAGGLVCEYTGVFPLYRCVKHSKRTRLNRRSFEDTGAGMDE